MRVPPPQPPQLPNDALTPALYPAMSMRGILTPTIPASPHTQVGFRSAAPLPSLEAGPPEEARFPWLVGGTSRAGEVELAQLGDKDGGRRRRLAYVQQARRGWEQGRLLPGWHWPLHLGVQAPPAPTHTSHTSPTAPALSCAQAADAEARVMPPPRMRPVSSMEPRPYLQRPTFSNCTVPVVWIPQWQNNMGHVLRGERGGSVLLVAALHVPDQGSCTLAEPILPPASDCSPTAHPPSCCPTAQPPPTAADSAAQLWPALQATPWRQHIKLVVQTPDGLAMSSMVGGTAAHPLGAVSVLPWLPCCLAGLPQKRAMHAKHLLHRPATAEAAAWMLSRLAPPPTLPHRTQVRNMLGPLSNMSVQTLADFSSRLPVDGTSTGSRGDFAGEDGSKSVRRLAGCLLAGWLPAWCLLPTEFDVAAKLR